MKGSMATQVAPRALGKRFAIFQAMPKGCWGHCLREGREGLLGSLYPHLFPAKETPQTSAQG